MNFDTGLSARSTSLADLMKFDPCFGEANPYPSHPAQYRAYHGARAWLFNPYTGARRHPCDVGTDPFGVLCVDPATMNHAQSSPRQSVKDTP